MKGCTDYELHSAPDLLGNTFSDEGAFCAMYDACGLSNRAV